MSTLSTLRTLFENLITGETSSTTTDPTQTLVHTYINTAIRKLARELKPRELQNATPSSVNIATGANAVTVPTVLMLVNQVYYTTSSGFYYPLCPKTLQHMILAETANSFFDTTNTGNPTMFTVRGTSIICNKYFDRTAIGAIKVYGISAPTTLANDSDACELPSDYDLAIVYEAGKLFYSQQEEPTQYQHYEQLASNEKKKLRFLLDFNEESEIILDPYHFSERNRGIENPSVFFGS